MILVLGGKGQLGRALSRAGRRDVVAVGREAIDVTRPETLSSALSRWRPSIVVNAAAWTDVDGAEWERARAFAVNAWGAGRVASLCAAIRVPLVHVSTDHVFDGRGDGPYAVDAPLRPANAYGASKAEGERRVRAAGGRVAIVRTAWVHGEDSGFPALIRRAAAQGRFLTGAVDEIGHPTPAEGLAAWILALCDDAPSGPWRTWHAVGAPAVSRWDWVRALAPGRPVRPVLSGSFGRPAVRPRDARLVVDTAYGAIRWRAP